KRLRYKCVHRTDADCQSRADFVTRFVESVRRPNALPSACSELGAQRHEQPFRESLNERAVDPLQIGVGTRLLEVRLEQLLETARQALVVNGDIDLVVVPERSVVEVG